MTTAPAVAGIRSIELEIAGHCNLACTHCCTSSSPTSSPGSMTRQDWQSVIDDAAAVGIGAVQLIGGEPTLSPHLAPLMDHAHRHRLGLAVEVYSNLTHVRPSIWARLERDRTSLATSYYTDDPTQHEQITQGRGSHARTLANIREALERGIPLRVGVVEVLEGQRVEEAVSELKRLGVKDIRVDRTRKIGRAAGGAGPSVAELCGRCFHQRAAVGPDGDVYGCILSRNWPTGNVRQRRLRDIIGSPSWTRTAAQVPEATASAACTPNDSSDCDPASTPACDPAYDYAPAASSLKVVA